MSFRQYSKLSTLAMALIAANSYAVDWKQFDGESITVLLPEHPVTEGIRTLLPEFEKQTGIDVNIQALAEDLYFDRMEVALRADKGVADAYFVPMDSTAYTQYTNGLIKSVQPYLNDPDMTDASYDFGDFPEGFVKATQYPAGSPDAGNYAIPASFEAYILFYNKQLVDKYLDGKVPQTMDELIAAAAEVKEESKGRVAGSVVRGIRSDTIIDTVSGFVYDSWGNRDVNYPQNVWFDGSWAKPQLDNPDILRGLTNYAELMKSGPINIQSIDWPDAERVFSQGRAAFFIDASLFAPGFEDKKASRVAGNVGYQVIPPVDANVGSRTAHWMWGLGIPENAQSPGASWYFIQWMTSKESEMKIGKLHGGAARQSTWTQSEYTSAFPSDYVSAVSEAMKTSKSSVVFKSGWSEGALKIVDVIQDIYKGEEPDQAVKPAQEFLKKFANK
ncbi:extracellular solute-binding protein [Vibrio mediterranei]|uniref:extracellular solute-binding protein n=1 Tax=Vibrio mediterranei TaxID=689 RepID=UPI00148B5A4B|nr:extracellular solute-binding protein [Vibrio mediterranei]NOH31320.1 extracellular solute-binding protein [Vibrio mediterranei]